MTAEFYDEDGEDLIDHLVSLEYDGKWRDENTPRGGERSSASCGPFWMRAEWNAAWKNYWAQVTSQGDDPEWVTHPVKFATLDEAKRACVAMLRECVMRMAKVVDKLEGRDER